MVEKENKKTEENIEEEKNHVSETHSKKENEKRGETRPNAAESEIKEKKKHVHKEREKPTKTEAVVNMPNVPISKKYSMAICKFIKNKRVSEAIVDLEQVIKLKKAVPMKGEIPHRKGKGMMSGRFPKVASENFIRILKSLSANAVYNNLSEPIIVECVANTGVRPYGRFGSVRKKRTHIKIVAKNKTELNKNI